MGNTGKEERLFNRIVAVHVITGCLLITLLISILSVAAYRYLHKAKQQDGKLVAGHISASGVDPIVQTLAYDRLPLIIEELIHTSPHVTYIVVHDISGNPVASGGSGEIAPLSAEGFRLYWRKTRDRPVWISQGNTGELVTALSNSREVIGIARIGLSETYIKTQITRIVLLLAGLGLVLLSASILLFVLFLSRKLDKPLSVTTQLMRSYGTDPDPAVLDRLRQVPAYSSGNEIGLMMKTFETLISNIENNKKRLETEKENIRTTLNSLGEAVIAVDTENRITRMNPVAATLTGFKETESIGRPLNDVFRIINAGTRGPAADPVQTVLENGRTTSLDHHTLLVSRDKSEYRIADSAAPIIDKNGKTIGVVLVFRDVTEAFEIQEKLRENEEKFRNIFHNSSDAIIIHDLSGRIMEINEAACRQLGYSHEELLRMTLADIDHPSFAVLISHRIQQIEKNGFMVFESIHRTKDNREIPVEISSRKIDHEKEECILSVARDITERKQAEEELIKNYNFIEALMDAIPTPVFYKDRDGRYQGCNRAFTDIMGVTELQIKGRTVHELWPGDHAAVYHRKDLELIEKQQHQIYEFKVRDKNGSIRPVVYAKNVFRDPQGNVAGLVGAFLDISDFKKAEEDLKKAKNYIANIINSMPSVIIGVDPGGRVTQWNREAKKATGILASEALGMPIEQVFPRLAGELDRVRKAVKSKETQKTDRQLYKVHGEVRYENLTVYPITSNGIEGAVIRIDDVTERVRLEEMMIQSEKMLSVGGLSAGMAHEINNPLGGMMQTAYVMQSRLTEDLPANIAAAEQAGISMAAVRHFMESRGIPRMLNNIVESGNRVSRIVTNMLSFARKSEAAFSLQDLAALTDQAVELAGSDYDLKKKYDFRRIEIKRLYDRDLPYVQCEPGKIQQVIMNILRNGAEAMHEAVPPTYGNGITADGSRKTTPPLFVLRLAHEKEAGMVRLEIEDNGPGMDQITKKRIFEPFFTTKPVGRGTGLGLSVSYFIVTKNHGGTMDVVSEPGSGTNFIIRLPVERTGK